MKESLKRYTAKRRLKSIVFLVLAFILLIFLGYKVNFSFTRIVKGLPDMFDLFKRILNPNISYIREVFEKLFETIEIAIISTLLGLILGTIFSLFISSNIRPSNLLGKILTVFFAVLRTIPSLIWAAILVSVFSIGKFPGMVALTIIAFLMSLKLFREYIEAIEENSLNAVRSLGASSIEVLRYGVFPHIFELFISTFFLVFETNIRSATVLGLVGAGGIGQIMWRDLNHLRYDNLAMLILILFSSILLIDLLSLFIRKYLLTFTKDYKDIKQFKRYKMAKLIIMPIFLIGIFYVVSNSLDISLDRLKLGMEQGVNIVKRIFTPNFSYYGKLIEGISESFFIAVFATLVGAFFSIILSYFAAYNTSPKPWIAFLLKALINIFRTFPPIVTAIIFFRGVGPGPLSGALALSIYTTGVLTKMYSEVLENAPENISLSIISTGSTRFGSYRYGLVPHTLPTFLSLSLYRFESNIRNSTILGIIGAGGIGTALSMNITWRNWENVGLLLLGTSILIIIVDSISNTLRKKFK